MSHTPETIDRLARHLALHPDGAPLPLEGTMSGGDYWQLVLTEPRREDYRQQAAGILDLLEQASQQSPMEVPATPLDLLKAASGDRLTLTAADGRDVTIRPFTREEYRAAYERSAARRKADGLPVRPAPTDEQIDQIIEPLPLTRQTS